MVCRTMLVQENLCMKALLLRMPNTQRSCLAVLKLPKYLAVTQVAGLVRWLNRAHL
jgi:hypothetical protein